MKYAICIIVSVLASVLMSLYFVSEFLFKNGFPWVKLNNIFTYL